MRRGDCCQPAAEGPHTWLFDATVVETEAFVGYAETPDMVMIRRAASVRHNSLPDGIDSQPEVQPGVSSRSVRSLQ